MITDYPNENDILVIVRKERDQYRDLAERLLLHLKDWHRDRPTISGSADEKLICKAEAVLGKEGK